MNILVTGGAGYVGSTLVPILLAEGHRVRVLDSLLHGGESLLGMWQDSNFEFLPGDIRDLDYVPKALAKMDAVVHLAAIVGDPACSRLPELARDTNLKASLQLIEQSKSAGVGRFVFASTCSNYGRMGDVEYVDETSALSPVSLYAETKVAVERALGDPTVTENLCASILRLATVYGVSPRMRFDLTVNQFTMEMLTKKELVVYGEQFWRPYIHVRDVARAVTLILKSPSGILRNNVFNVGATEENFQKAQLVELLRPYEPACVVRYVSVAEDPRDYRVCFSKINNYLNFRISRTVQDGIQEVARLVRSGIIRQFDDPRYRN